MGRAVRAGDRARAWLARNRIDVALVGFGLALLLPIVSLDSAQPASRMALTAAVAEHGTVDVAGYPLSVDRAVYRSHLRSDKAPGQPLLALPVYELSRVLGAESASHKRTAGNLGLWFVTVFSSLLPFLALLVLMRRAVARFAAPTVSVAVALTLGFGSLLLPYSVNLFGHALAAALAFGAWLVLDGAPRDRRALLWSGLLAGAAVAVEYQVGIIALVLAAFALVVARRGVLWFLLGSVPPALVVGVYQWRAFGAPWRLPFGYFAGTINGTTQGGYTVPGIHGFEQVLAGDRGLLLLSPVVLVGMGAVVASLRSDHRDVRTHALVGGAIALGYVVLIAGWSGTPTLESPGPRYLVPVVPFLAIPLAALWSRLRVVAVISAIWGGCIQLVAATTSILIVQRVPLLPDYWDRIREHVFVPTVWSMALGRPGVVLYAASVVLCAYALVRCASSATRVRRAGPGSPVPASTRLGV